MATRRINLLPPELETRRRGRRTTGLIGVAAVGVLVLFLLLYLVQVFRLSRVENDLEAQEQENGRLRVQVSRLQEFDDLEKALHRKIELLDELTRSEIRWSVVLADISLVIPSDVWLTNFSGSVQPAAAEGAAEPEEGTAASLGNIQLNGTTFSHNDVARWLSRLGKIDSFGDPYLSLSSRAQVGDTPVVDFNSSVKLTEKAFRRSQRGADRPTS